MEESAHRWVMTYNLIVNDIHDWYNAFAPETDRLRTMPVFNDSGGGSPTRQIHTKKQCHTGGDGTNAPPRCHRTQVKNRLAANTNKTQCADGHSTGSHVEAM